VKGLVDRPERRERRVQRHPRNELVGTGGLRQGLLQAAHLGLRFGAAVEERALLVFELVQ